MPDYRYLCSNENCEHSKEVVTINCKMSEYNPHPLCECGSELNRTTESLVCNYSDCVGFYGKRSN